VFRHVFGVSQGGNWEGTNILHRPDVPERIAAELGLATGELDELEARGRQRLYELRSAREWPDRDEKVVASWNAMMLAAFAEAGRVLGRADYVEAADACADFILKEMRRDGRLLRTWRDGTAKIDGFLEDYALLVDALLTVYGATFDTRRVEQAGEVADRMIELFWDPAEELFFDTPSGGERLVVRPRDIYDNATPSGTSAATRALVRLGRLTGGPEYERLAGRVLRSMARVATELPQGFGLLLSVLAHHLSTPTEVALVGEPNTLDTEAMLAVVNRRFLPHTTVALLDPRNGSGSAAIIPLLADRPMRDGRVTAYVCRQYTCKQPVTEPRALELDLALIRSGAETSG
ncbi:MAG TPA: hypothetical protein VMN39_05015, partial [Longimicrobiaceae bacterium]|nr:hypothetical protein [Longimicrobiaceae bacterium]